MLEPIRIRGGHWNDRQACIVFEQSGRLHTCLVLGDRIEVNEIGPDTEATFSKAWEWMRSYFSMYSNQTYHWLNSSMELRLKLSREDKDRYLAPLWNNLCDIMGKPYYKKRIP